MSVPEFVGFCPVCQRDSDSSPPNSNLVLVFFDGFCPVCHRTSIVAPVKKPMAYEDAPERLIEVIQGKGLKEEREQAFVKLIGQFQYLIQKTARSLFNSYSLDKKYGEEFKDFLQDTIAEFIDLTLNDFKIKSSPNEPGLAYFGTYIKLKLYRRVQSQLQKRIKDPGYGSSSIVDFAGGQSDDRNTNRVGAELREALIANSLGFEEVVIGEITDERCKQIITDFYTVAEAMVAGGKLSERDWRIWRMYWTSGMMAEEIAKDYQNEVTGENMSRSWVFKLAHAVNTRIVTEYGRFMAVRASGIDVFPKGKGR